MLDRQCFWAIVLLVTMSSSSPAYSLGKEVEERKWLQVRTENFEIHSQLSKKETLELVRHLEIFRHVAAVFTGVGLADSPVPTAIYAVPSGKVARELSLGSRFAGIFSPGLRRNLIVVKDVHGTDEVATIMHEYVHFLIENFGDFNYPMWFYEGFAEYLSSMKVRSDEIIIGSVAPGRVAVFSYVPWIDMRNIIARRGDDEWTAERNALFYAEAWALVHYLMNRTDQPKRFNDQLEDYVRQLDAGTDSIESFEAAFGESVEAFDRAVRNYIGKKRVPGIVLAADSVVPEFEPEVTQMSREEASLALGRLALRNGDFDRAERWYRIASADPALEAHARGGLGDTLKFRDRFDEALPHFERALDLAPEDPLCQLDMAEYWDYRAEHSNEPSERDEYIDLARTHYLEAWKLNPNLPETYAMYGRTYLTRGDDYNRAVEMLEEAQRLLRSSTRVKLYLAEAYLGAGRTDDARIAAQSVLSWSHGESEAANKAQQIVDESVVTAGGTD